MTQQGVLVENHPEPPIVKFFREYDRVAVVCGSYLAYKEFLHKNNIPPGARYMFVKVMEMNDILGREFDDYIFEHGWNTLKEIDRIMECVKSHLKRKSL